MDTIAHFLKKGAKVHNNISNKILGSILNETTSLYTTKKREYKSLKQYKKMIKIAVVGDTDVGKSSLVSRFVNRNKKPDTDHTVGVDVTVTTIHVHNTIYHVKFFDLSGMYGYDSLYDQYLQNVESIVVVYDVTSYKTFVRAKKYVDKIVTMHGVEYPILLVGNKMDQVARRRVDMSKALGYVNGKANTFYIETSAEHGGNTTDCLKMLVSEASRNRKCTKTSFLEEEKPSGCGIV